MVNRTPRSEGKLIIAANRLPVTVKTSNGAVEYVVSPGGLATGLSSLDPQRIVLWVGWPGTVAKEDKKRVEGELVGKFGYHPVFLPESVAERYYEGYSNRTIWPIFHSMPTYAKFSAVEWEAYQRANQMFATRVLEIYKPGDVLWIHDYHLLLLAKLLRDKHPDAAIGFFLQIPFPHYDIFRLLPQHREILEQMLAPDLVGFHTHDYAQSFLGCVRRLLGHDNTLGQIMVGDRAVQVDVFPMGIDYAKYSGATHDPEAAPAVERMRNRLKSRTTVFSVSRLDYTKGIPESLEAIEEFFTRHPEWHEKIIFILVVVPSREGVERYASLKREIDERVGAINSRYGTLFWIPVGYIYRSLQFSELIGLYASADVALVTPLRDGMNLVAKEYLAVKNMGAGVLILSEMAGAAKELPEAIIVNPNSKEDLASAIERALAMPKEEQKTRNTMMCERIKVHDIHHWVSQFLRRLDEAIEISHALAVKMLDAGARQEIVRAYRQAQRRLLLLDYDGTLVPFARQPSEAVPDSELLDILRGIAAHETTRLVLLSGRDRESLGEWFGGERFTLVAEHGGWIRAAGNDSWISTLPDGEGAWKKDVRPVLELFVHRIPESFIEEKTFSLVWHYRNADHELGVAASRELLDTLSNLTSNLNVRVVPGSRSIEVRTIGVSKGAYFQSLMAAEQFDFVLAAGDDWTDEDLFAVLPPTAFSIKVGVQVSKARFNLRSSPEVRALLRALAGARRDGA